MKKKKILNSKLEVEPQLKQDVVAVPYFKPRKFTFKEKELLLDESSYYLKQN